nr:polypeptide N-acetylgalactosaminyltransferase 9-like [Penaeus vannamei]
MEPSKCKEIHYDADLPSASVIIIFTNEAWTPLIRTIWSVLTRSPSRFLKEIVLVDDFSDRAAELGEKLDLYLNLYLPPLVRLVRLGERHGLIRRGWRARGRPPETSSSSSTLTARPTRSVSVYNTVA